MVFKDLCFLMCLKRSRRIGRVNALALPVSVSGVKALVICGAGLTLGCARRNRVSLKVSPVARAGNLREAGSSPWLSPLAVTLGHRPP